MIRVVQSPGLGWVLVYNTPFRPGLAPWLPAFHVDEIRLLSSCKAITVDDWRAVVLTQQVFPGAYVVEVRDLAAERARWERRMKRTKRWSPGPSLHVNVPAEGD